MSIEESSFRQVMRNLQREIEKIENGSIGGLLRGVIVIRRSMDKDPPLIPVDTGNLRQSWFVTAGGGRVSSESRADSSVVAAASSEAESALKRNVFLVIMGFSANYAIFVHENVGAHFKRPNAGAKFFEAAIQRNLDRVLDLIRQGGVLGK